MSELDERQKAILGSWKDGHLVAGFNGGEFGIQHAMMSAVSVQGGICIGSDLMTEDYHGAGCLLAVGVRHVARELAASQMGYPYLADAEEAMKAKLIENFSATIRSTSEAKIYYTIDDKEINSIIDLDVAFEDGEPESRDCPETPASAEIIGTFGLSVSESHDWTKYLSENRLQIEQDLLKMREQEKCS